MKVQINRPLIEVRFTKEDDDDDQRQRVSTYMLPLIQGHYQSAQQHDTKVISATLEQYTLDHNNDKEIEDRLWAAYRGSDTHTVGSDSHF